MTRCSEHFMYLKQEELDGIDHVAGHHEIRAYYLFTETYLWTNSYHTFHSDHFDICTKILAQLV